MIYFIISVKCAENVRKKRKSENDHIKSEIKTKRYLT